MVKFIDLNKRQISKLTFDKAGEYLVFLNNLSGQFNFEINSPGVDLSIFGLYIGSGNDQFAIDTIQHHRSPSSTSNLFIRGVFYDYSKFTHHGLVRIEKKAQKSHAYQKNQNLMLSPYCFIESKPFLEILADDVFCTHGSTTGRLDREQIFYVKSRGLNDEEAEKLLVDGFINEITNQIKEKLPKFDAKKYVRHN